MPESNVKARGIPLLRKVKPSYLVLLALLPLFVLLFVADDTYQDALKFILPGIVMTVSLTFTAYTLAFVWGLALAGMQFLKKQEKTSRNYFFASAAILLLGSSLFLLPQQGYVLIGEPTGTVAIIQGTPRSLSDAVRNGTYAEGAESRAFRSVTDTATALSRIEAGRYTGALILKNQLPEDGNVLWETSVIPSGRLNMISFLLAIGLFVFLLTFGSWHSLEHPLAIFADLYIDVVRGIPMLVLIVFIGLILPGELGKLGLLVEPGNDFLRNLQRGTLAVGLAYAAFMAEIFRAGIQAVPRGQSEAARSLGLSSWQTVRHVVLPQAIKIVIPPLGNEFIAMFKDTALVSVIGVQDIFRNARAFGADRLNNLPPYYTAAVIYIILTLGASSVLQRLERRTNTGGKH